MEDPKLFAAYMKHYREVDGRTEKEALAMLADQGLAKAAALARAYARKHRATSWAGVADKSAPAPGRDGKGKHRVKS